MNIMKAAAVAALAVATSGSIAAASGLGLDLRPANPGGEIKTYELSNGNYLGLWGISGGAGLLSGAQNTGDLIDDFGTNKNSIVGFFYSTPPAPGAWAGSPAEFDPFGATFEIATTNGTDKLFDSFWVEWTGGNLFNRAGNSNMAASATLEGDPLAAQVPVPAALPLLAAALGGLGFASRRRKAA